MLKFADKTIYMEGVLVLIEEGKLAFDLKGRLGYLEIPEALVAAEHPIRIGQEFGWDMSFPEQTGEKPCRVEPRNIAALHAGELETIEGNVISVSDGSVGFELGSFAGTLKVPMRMMLCDYQIVEGQPIGFRMSAPRQLSAEPNEKYVSNLDTYKKRQAMMQAGKKIANSKQEEIR